MLADATTDSPPVPAVPASWHLCLLAGLLAAALSVATLFTNLSGPRLEPDEAYYALATDDIHTTGRWLTVYIHPTQPYFNKPPLYFWLSSLTYDCFDKLELRYRFWSAVFGVLAVGLTASLGARLFRVETGLVAGAILATNRAFLFEHGARFGGMDAGLTACFAGMLLIYWMNRQRGGWIAAAAIGLLAGVAMLFKPLGGLPMLLIIGVHAAASRGNVSSCSINGRTCWKQPARLLAIAVGVTLAISLPWYIAQYARFGQQFSGKLFGQQLADRLTGIGPAGEHKPFTFYFTELFTASNTFWLLLPALLWSALQFRKATAHRTACSLLVLCVVGWVVGFSLSSGKFLHYLYPVFPCIAILIAAWLMHVVLIAVQFFGSLQAAAKLPAAGGVARWALVAGYGAYACYVAANSVARTGSPLPAWDVYRVFEPAIRDGRVALRFWGVPHTPADWPSEHTLRPSHMIYFAHMTGGRAVASPAELAAEIASGQPTIVIYGRGEDLQAVPAMLKYDASREARYSVDHLPFAVAVLNADRVLKVTSDAARVDPRLTVKGGNWPAVHTGDATLAIQFPLPQPARLSFLVRATDASRGRTVRCRVTNASRDADIFPAFVFTGTHRISVGTSDLMNRKFPLRPITIHVEPMDGQPGPIAFELVDATLEVLPPIPTGESGLGY